MADVYDGYLVVVLSLLLLGATASLHSAVALRDGLAAASFLSSIVILEMLFRNPPSEPDPTLVEPLALVGMGWVLVIFELR